MYSKRIQLFKLFGFSVGIDVTWFILAILITWTFATVVIPERFKGLSTITYWLMGVGGALGLFVSIVFHEFCHSLVARHYGMRMKGITLFIFGGVAEMADEPDNPKAEFLMAIAGPASSVLLAAGLYLAYILGGYFLPISVTGVFWFLGQLNLVLAVFNLMPAFPLDGGRVLRSILWAIKKDLRWATKIASGLGSAFGMFLIVMGVLLFIQSEYVSGIWSAMIGMFIRSASQMSYRQVLLRKSFTGEKVRRFMKPQPVTVSPAISIEKLVNDYFYKYHFKMFPVIDGDMLIGCVTAGQVKDIPKDQWAKQTVGDVAGLCSVANTISPDTDAIIALSVMNSTGNSRLMVVDNGQLVGVITLKDMLKFLHLKIDLEGSS